MSTTAPARSGPAATSARTRLRAVIPHRIKVSPLTAVLLAIAFAIAITPIIRIDLWLSSAGALEVRPGAPAPVTVRVPPFADASPNNGSIVIARGELATAQTAQVVAAVRARTPHGAFGDLAYFAVVLALTAIYTLQLRRSTRGRFLRTQLVLLGVLAVAAGIVKALMLLTPISVLAVPVALLALITAITIDREAGVATGVLASVVVALLVPFDIGVTAILLVQALTASLLLPDRIRRRWRVALVAGFGAAVTGALAYGIVHFLTRGSAPVDELGRLGASSWVAAACGGVIAALVAVPAVPLMQMACGEITDGALIALEDLSHPMLKQIAEKSPGTWQHSLAMANMAEVAANAIGANGRLVRVGAYFHDLGKSLQSKYFIENVDSGEQSPHDRLPPEVSCDAIFAHVTEGIALGRQHRLPERIIDFMHMHHGDGVLEYFWAKCREQGNPNQLTAEDFRYPGVPPQSRETAILAICDAVEAASRTLRRPDQQAIGNLVQRIVYGKLHLGQLDESGLSMADLRKISDSLRETIKHAHHGRIEYPWQVAERAAEVREEATVVERPPQAGDSITQRIMDEPRLDSLDAPRPPWASGGTGPGARPSRPSAPALAEAGAATVPVTTPPTGPTDVATMSLRPAAYADSVDVAHAATAQVAAPVLAAALGEAPRAEPPPALVALAPPLPPVELAHAPTVPPVAIADTQQIAAARPPVETTVEVPAPASAAPLAEAPAEAPPAEAPPPAPPAEVVAAGPRWSGTFAAAAVDALSDVVASTPAPEPEPAPPAPATPWGARLADRIDAFLDEPSGDEAAPESGEPPTVVRHTPPPPPGRRARSTLEIGAEDVEATIELAPSGPIVGPPPGTRAAPQREAAAEVDDPSDDEVTVVPTRPPSSMMPPRARTHGKPRE